MANKVWSPAEMEAARKLIAAKRGTPKSWPLETEEAVTLQCELTEAMKLLRTHPSLAGFSVIEVRNDWKDKVSEFLKRNEAL